MYKGIPLVWASPITNANLTKLDRKRIHWPKYGIKGNDPLTQSTSRITGKRLSYVLKYDANYSRTIAEPLSLLMYLNATKNKIYKHSISSLPPTCSKQGSINLKHRYGDATG